MIRYADPQGFAELGVTTNFSFLRGASHPEELVAQAIALGLDAIGIADRNSLAGVVRAHLFLRHNKDEAGGLRVVPGARLVFCDGTPDILAYPTDRAAWGRLCRLLTIGNIRAEKGTCRLTLDDLVAWQDGLRLVALPASTFEPDVEARLAGRHFPEWEATPTSSFVEGEGGEGRGEPCGASWRWQPQATAPGRIESSAVTEDRGAGGPLHLRRSPSPATHRSTEEDALSRLAARCPGRLWIGAVMGYGRSPRGDLLRRRRLADRLGACRCSPPTTSAMHDPARRPLLDIVTCIRHGTTLEAAGRLLSLNAERHLKPAAEMRRLFAEAPEAVAETLRFAEGLTFSLDELGNDYPEELREGFATPQEALATFAEEGARRRYPPETYPERCARPRHVGHRPRARSRAADGLRALLPHRARHRAFRQIARHPVPGPRLGRQLDAVLLPRHHRGRPRPPRPAVRALHLGGPQRAARHRCRFRARAARGS